MTTITFSKWSGPDGIEQFIINQTGCKPYSGAGINPRIEKKTTILKFVDNTYYYHDDMSDINNIQYTLFGHNGDQDETEKKFNEPLLHLCTFKTPIINTVSLGFYEFYSLEHIFLSYYKHLPKCSYNILSV